MALSFNQLFDTLSNYPTLSVLQTLLELCYLRDGARLVKLIQERSLIKSLLIPFQETSKLLLWHAFL